MTEKEAKEPGMWSDFLVKNSSNKRNEKVRVTLSRFIRPFITDVWVFHEFKQEIKELTLIFSLLITYIEITSLQIVKERIPSQWLGLGFCLNVLLQNESTNLWVSQKQLSFRTQQRSW